MKAVRSGKFEYLATNDRGAIVKIGRAGEPDVFSPGELLQLASATCIALSAEARITHAIPDPFISLNISVDKNSEENRYEGISTDIVVDLSSLSAEELSALKEKVDEAVARACTVGRTLKNGASTTWDIHD